MPVPYPGCSGLTQHWGDHDGPDSWACFMGKSLGKSFSSLVICFCTKYETFKKKFVNANDIKVFLIQSTSLYKLS